jgi:hypothetical protein
VELGVTGVFYVDTPSLSQDFNWTRGAHQISFGASWTRPHPNGDGTFQSNGNMGFSGLITSGTTNANGGLNMADFVLGYPATYRGGGSQINNAWIQSIGFYGADVWRLNRRLTLNYGLRWEPYLAAKDANGFNTAFIRDNFDKGIRSTVYVNAPVGLVFPGDPGFPTNKGNTYNNLNQLAPRFGFVWDPRGDSKQTIRAGTGIYYDSPKLWETAHHMLNPPFGNTVDAVVPTSCPGKPSRNGCPLDFVNVWSSTPGGDPQATFGHMGEPVNLAPSTTGVPDQRRLRQHAAARRSDADVSVEPVVSAAGLVADAVRGHLHGEQDRSHLGGRLRRESGDLHSRQLPGGPVRADGAGTVLEHERHQPSGARAADTAQSGRGQVLLGEQRLAGLPRRDRSLPRRQVQPPEAPQQQLERERELHLREVHQPRRAGDRHRQHLPGAADRPDFEPAPRRDDR